MRLLHRRIVRSSDEMSSEVVVCFHHGKHGDCVRKLWKAYTKGMQESSLRVRSINKSAARQRFYVVPKFRNQSLRRMHRLFISLRSPSMDRVIRAKMVTGNGKFANATSVVVTCIWMFVFCDDQADMDMCISPPFHHSRGAKPTAERRY